MTNPRTRRPTGAAPGRSVGPDQRRIRLRRRCFDPRGRGDQQHRGNLCCCTGAGGAAKRTPGD